MKKQLYLLLISLILLMTASALAEAAWTCPNCGLQGNTGNFCPQCGSSQPQRLEWDCPNCGLQGNTSNFCPQCGTPRSSGSGWYADENQGYDGQWSLPAQDPWPALSSLYAPVSLRIVPNGSSTERYYAYAGPGRSYVMSGGYLPHKVQSVQAYFVENSFVFIHLDYQTVADRFLYLPKWNFYGAANLPVVSGHDTWPARTSKAVTPYWGPGSQYAQHGDFALRSGQDVQVLFESNGFVYAEYTTGKGPVRMWLPRDVVDPV